MVIPVAAAPLMDRILLFVAKVGAGKTAAASILAWSDATQANPSCRMGLGGAQTNVYWGGAYVVSGPAGTWTGEHRVHSIQLSNAAGTGTCSVRQNGSVIQTGTRAYSSFSTITSFDLNRSKLSVEGHDLEVKEIMVLPYSAENLANAEAYLAAKHRITLV